MDDNNPKGRPKNRNRHSGRRGRNAPRRMNARMNNNPAYDLSDVEKYASTGSLEYNTSSLNKAYNNSGISENTEPWERSENAGRFCRRVCEESDNTRENLGSKNLKPIDVLNNFASCEQTSKNFNVENKQNNMSSNLFSSNPNYNDINVVRDLLAEVRDKTQHLEPFTVINNCRETITSITEECTTSHWKRTGNISSKIRETEGRYKTVLEKHVKNMSSQFSCFQQFVQKVKCELNDLHRCEDVMEIMSKTEEILDRVKSECMRFGKTLPAYCLNNEIEVPLNEKQVIIISCDAVYYGNIVIPIVAQSTLNSGIVVSCEVNDLSALSSAKFCASLTDQKLGYHVGYEIEKESLAGKATKIIYTTVQEMFSKSLKDPAFSRFSCIVINQLLKRSIEADILLSSIRECLQETRKDLKLILLVPVEEIALKMKEFFSKVVGTTLITTEDLIFPVQVIWKEAPCNSGGDCVTEAANICLAIHALNEEGDVLAFLPSEEDALKASGLTASSLLEYSFRDAECVHISEKTKGKKALEIIQEKHGKRNIIFTHHGFEAVTFQNVRYVIDSGRIREICYDPKKKVEVQKTSFISRSRAKVRKNVAGRYVSGICYRMYNKENYVKNMMSSEVPDLLTRSPLNSLVQIFQYKPDSALTLDFVEPFSEQVKENALKSLKSFGALKNDKLTRLGELMVKLPFPPRYSKLIVIGIQWGFPFEAIVIVSLFLVKGYFFKYQNTEEFKKKVDAAKLHFNQDDSDTLTFLNIYKEWTKAGYNGSWCEENCIEYQFLEDVQAKVNELCDIVYKNLETSEINKFSDEFKWGYLQEAIFECFKDNLCVYTGHFLSGYRSLTAQCLVFLHPSTSIPRKENLPQFIVYDKFVSKSRNFVTHTTSVPETCVTEALKNDDLEFTHHDLFERKLISRVIDHVGDTVIRHVLKKEKLRELEEEIKDKTKCELIVIEPSVEKGNVTLYALPDDIQKVEEAVRRILQEKMENLRHEAETLILELKRGSSVVPLSISWSSGAKISSVNLGAQQNVNNTCGFNSSGCTDGADQKESTTHSCIHLSWVRRPCSGVGYVGFHEPGDFSKARRLALSTIQVRGREAGVQINRKKNYELCITDLHPETTESNLKEAIEACLPAGVCVSSVEVVLLPPYETRDSDIREIESQLKKTCQDILKTFVAEVKATKPDKKDKIMNAEIKLRNDSNLALQAAALSSALKMGGVRVKAKPIYYSNLFCNAKVVKAIEPRIRESLQKFEKDLSRSAEVVSSDDLFKFEAETHDYLTAKLKLSAYTEKIITDLRKIVQDLLEGNVITSSDISGIHKLFCHGGHMWLENLGKMENVHIIDEDKSKVIRLYGTADACARVSICIGKFLSSAEEEAVKHIILADGKDSRVLLKAIIEHYGFDLKKQNFIETCGLRSAELDIRKCQLTLHGSPESIEKAENELEKLASQFNPSYFTDIQANQEMCPVCFCPALTLTYRLENCSHLYCDGCIKGLLGDVEIPLKCCAEGCGTELILEDIRRILGHDKEKINELLSQSLKDYLKSHRNFVYCPAPDCSMFVDKEKVSGTKWNCPLCHNDICIACNTIYHHGYSCDMYQGSKKDSDYSFKVWKQTAVNCKMCPVCGTAIQKTEGCNHMTCFSCRGHFCWLCEKAFPSGKEVYNHLPFCPKNQG